jgi:hypothetical protein
MNRRLAFSALAVIGLLAACSGSGTSPRHPTASPEPSTTAGSGAPSTVSPSGSPSATPSGAPTPTSPPLIFVSVCNATCGGSAPDEVLAFAVGALTPSKTITNGLANPIALGIDGANDLLVENCVISPCDADPNEGSVGIYSAGAVTPRTTVTNGISVPDGLAVASDGTFAVSNCVLCDTEIEAGRHRQSSGSVQDSVTVYSIGGALLTTITNGIESPGIPLFDSSDTLYVPNFDSNTVTIYPKNATTPTRTLATGVSGPKALLLDASGTVYVANAIGNDVQTFPAGANSASRTLATDPGPTALASGPGGVLYVATGQTSTSNGNVEVFVNFAFSRRITDGVDLPVALAVDAAGDLFVANQGSNSLTEYRASALAPFATVPLPASPTALALTL